MPQGREAEKLTPLLSRSNPAKHFEPADLAHPRPFAREVLNIPLRMPFRVLPALSASLPPKAAVPAQARDLRVRCRDDFHPISHAQMSAPSANSFGTIFWCCQCSLCSTRSTEFRSNHFGPGP